jgi:hypothetical protein
MKFPYQRYEVEPSATIPDGVLFRPELPIRVIGLTGDAALLVLADTGADETLLPRSVGELIGAEVDEARTWSVAGFGGQEVAVVLAEVELELGSRAKTHRWRTKVGLVDFPNPEDETAVLGHVGFFDHFTAHFNTRRRQLTINPHRRASQNTERTGK